MTAVQLDLFGLVADALTIAERQQVDWTAWLQDQAGRWCCPACGQVEATAQDLHRAHGWRPDLAPQGHPYYYDWPQVGRCAKLRRAHLQAIHDGWPKLSS